MCWFCVPKSSKSTLKKKLRLIMFIILYRKHDKEQKYENINFRFSHIDSIDSTSEGELSKTIIILQQRRLCLPFRLPSEKRHHPANTWIWRLIIQVLLCRWRHYLQWQNNSALEWSSSGEKLELLWKKSRLHSLDSNKVQSNCYYRVHKVS